MKIADQIAKRTPSITLKPIQLVSSDTQREHRINVCRNQERLLSSPSSSTFLSPPTTLSFLSNCHTTFVTPGPNPVRRAGETLEERARRILGPCITIHENDRPIPTLQAPNFEKDKKQLIDNMKSCLKTIEMSQQAADHLCQLHNRGIDCHEALNFFFKVHSTTFYMKATTSAQIEAAFSAGLRLSWSDVADIINALKADIHHQQLFMAQVASANYISTKIDSTTSIAMSSKLAYQLTKLSR